MTYTVGQQVQIPGWTIRETPGLRVRIPCVGVVVRLSRGWVYVRKTNGFAAGHVFTYRPSRLSPCRSFSDIDIDRHEEPDDDPVCVCGVYRSEHALCGCGEWERLRSNP